jgi:glycosyltransferase involved in cell wall biosynthesis
MKVLRITASLSYGGIEKVIELHAKYHRREDYELVIVALGSGGRTEEYIRSLGYRVIVLHVKYRIPNWNCFIQLVSLLRSERPDVVHTCGAEANFHGQLAAFIAGIPRRVGEEIGIPSHSRTASFIFRIVYTMVHKVIAISESVKNYLTRFEAPAKKVEVVYNPIDLDFKGSVPFEVSPDVFRISCVCRLEPIKNLFLLIDLLEVLQRRGDKIFELWLVGDGSQRVALANYAVSKGVERHVRFAGFVAQPQSLLRQTNLFILPSFYEGFGLACIEAIQCGLPVIVSNSGGMVEYITEGVHGFLFNPKSLDELIQKVDTVLSLSHAELATITEKALERVNEMFSPQKYLAELNRVYQI